MKKLTSIIICIAMILTAIPLYAFAQEEITPYCEIKLKEGFKTEILPGESVELYLEYDKGDYRSCSFDWHVSGGGTFGEYESLGFIREDGIRITAYTHGTITVKMSLISKDADTYNQVIAEDKLEITVLDTRTEEEKFRDEFDKFVTETNFAVLFTTFFIFIPMLLSPITTPIGIIKSVIEIWQLK